MYQKIMLFIAAVVSPFLSFATDLDKTVYVGWAGVQSKELIKNINSKNKKSSMVMLDRNKTLYSMPALQWSQSQNEKDFIDVGTVSNPVYICRANVPNVIGREAANYPGQWDARYCTVSANKSHYAKKDFFVLTGNKNLLRWISIATVMRTMKIHMSVNAFANSNQYPYGFNLENFNFNIQINGYMPISGGDEGGNPVLICSIKTGSQLSIGKMIFLGNSLGCEVVINQTIKTASNHFNLLFGKVKTSSNAGE